MIEYFKEKWEELNDESLRYEVEDVINIRSGSAKVMNDNEVQGMEDNVINEDFYGYSRSEVGRRGAS
ncbi:hypothetical protein Tco_0076828 [Tanacetum coccineum]